MVKTKSATSKKKVAVHKKTKRKAQPAGRFSQRNIVIAVAAFLIVAVSGIFLWQTTFAATPKERHFIQNTDPGTDAKTLKAMGYNIIDVNPDTSQINALPSGTQAMVWTGDAFCDKNIMKWSSFKSFVYKNRNNAKIYGYFIEDEPNVKGCPHIVKVMRDRADYIHCFAIQSDKFSNGKPKVAADGSCLDDKGNKVARKSSKKAYIVDEYNHDYAKVSEKLTHVDIFAIDPYPCRPSGCKYSGGDDEFLQRIERAKKYYPQSKIAPTYQAFGGDGWRLPTAAEMRKIQSYYDKYLPGSTFDVAYSYRDNKSGGPGDTYPGLIHAPASLKAVMKEHNFAN